MKTLFGEQINTLNLDSIYNHVCNGEYSHLSDVELVYSIVGDEEIAARICQTAGNDWSSLFRFSAGELMKVPGVGKKRAVALVAAMEMGRRRSMQGEIKKMQIHSSKDVYKVMHPVLADLEHEELWAIMTNNTNRIISKAQIAKGGRCEVSADVCIILKKAIECNAMGLFVIHNHPSGATRPSHQDDSFTDKLSSAVKYLGIRLLDHVILAGNTYYSYSDEGRLG